MLVVADLNATMIHLPCVWSVQSCQQPQSDHVEDEMHGNVREMQKCVMSGPPSTPWLSVRAARQRPYHKRRSVRTHHTHTSLALRDPGSRRTDALALSDPETRPLRKGISKQSEQPYPPFLSAASGRNATSNSVSLHCLCFSGGEVRRTFLEVTRADLPILQLREGIEHRGCALLRYLYQGRF